MILKKHIHQGKLVLALCDNDLLGNTYEEDNKVLDLKSSFYQGEVVQKEELEPLIEDAVSIHCVGKESITYLKTLNLIDEVNTIQHIPFVILVFD